MASQEMPPAPPAKSHLPLEVTPEEAAKTLGVHPRTVRNMIKNKQLDATKVNRKWYIKRQSVINAKGSEQPNPKQKTYGKGPRDLAAYRLCLHAFEHFDLQVGIEDVDLRIKKRQWDIIEYLGAGFFSYGTEKIRHYRQARASLGALLGLIHATDPESKAMKKALEFLELECNAAMGSLLRKFENPRPKGKAKAHAAPPSLH